MFDGSRKMRANIATVLAVCFWLAIGLTAVAHETDQFTVPSGRVFGDLRHYFSAYLYKTLSSAVDEVNAEIERTLVDGQPTPATAAVQSPEAIASAFIMRFPPPVIQIEGLQLTLHDPGFSAGYPGVVSAYLPVFVIYHNPALAINFTNFWRLVRTSTVMIDGVYMGTDKIDHFLHVGYAYWQSYRRARAAGVSEQAAVQRAVETGTGMDPLFSERTVLGLLVTGVMSNGDLAANYAGFKFYRNLTERIVLAGRVRPPILVREGHYWRLNDHVHPRSDFFTVFVSDHWDEALNPSTYAPAVKPFIRDEVKRRCDDLLAWYTDREGRPLDREQFWAKLAEMRTYFGEDYGHVGDLEELVSIASVCFDDEAAGAECSAGETAPADRDEAVVGDVVGRDVCGRTPLWWAASDGQSERVRALVSAGADVNAADVDGETALHTAARWGYFDIVEVLLAAGADANAETIYGTRPLHLAVREIHHRVVAALIERGAVVDAEDVFGCTPLYDTAAIGDDQIAVLLIEHGADPLARNKGGVSPLLRAERSGHEKIVSLLNAAVAKKSIAGGKSGGDDGGTDNR